MKLTFLTIATFFSFASSFAQSEIKVKVTGNIFNTTVDSISISQFMGTYYVDYIKVPLKKNGDFILEGKVPSPDFYVLKLGEDRVNLILRDKSDIQVYADGKDINTFGNIVGSQESANLKKFILEMQVWNMQKEKAQKEMQAQPEKRDVLQKSLENNYNQFISKRQAFIQENVNSPALLPALSTFDPNTEWGNFEMVAKQLENSLPGSKTIKSNFDNYTALKAQRQALDFLEKGKPAPDFEEKKIDGSTMKLSDLKGQVVLLDFWASWCAPCRAENPNVVRLYEKYKAKGFTVMSVSLDKDGNKWQEAIKRDNLSWPNHVSDLKGWECQAAKKYQVRGIPFTVLIDKEGNIIDTKLRGEQLAFELEKIFGK